MNHGELWVLDGGPGIRCVLSMGQYNEVAGYVVSAAVGPAPAEPSPLRIAHRLGTVHVDKLLYHPREWLAAPVGRLDEDATFELHRQLRLLLELG